MSEVNELIRFQKELKEEEQLIVSMLAKIDEQLHTLQVEQLQLLNAKYSKDKEPPMSQGSSTNKTTPSDANVKKELDLAVSHIWQESEDEEDESN